MLFCVFFSGMKSFSQEIESYKWEKRVLLIFSDAKNNKKLQQQIEILSKDKKGLKERKLKIYQFSENQFTTDFSTVWLSSALKTEKYKRKSEHFKVVLIGLDGGIKLKQNDLLSLEKLVTMIDGMPMRKREVKSKNK